MMQGQPLSVLIAAPTMKPSFLSLYLLPHLLMQHSKERLACATVKEKSSATFIVMNLTASLWHLL